MPTGPAARQAISEAARSGAIRLVGQWEGCGPEEPWARPIGYPIANGLKLAEGWWAKGTEEGEIVVEPMDAFGSGLHPSTWLNAGALGQVIEAGLVAHQGWAVDLGSGSGVLSLVTAALSPVKVLAVDPAVEARRAIARNKALNPSLASQINFVQATHEVLGGPFILGTANLPLPIMTEALPALARALAVEAVAVLSGLRTQAQCWLEKTMQANGLEPIAWGKEAGWIVVVGKKVGRDGAI